MNNPLTRTYDGWFMVSGMSLGAAAGALWATVQPSTPLIVSWAILGIVAFARSLFASMGENDED